MPADSGVVIPDEKKLEFITSANQVIEKALKRRRAFGHPELAPAEGLPSPARGNVYHTIVPLLMPLVSYAFVLACYLYPPLRPGFPFLCLFVSGFFVPFHWGFVFNLVKLTWPYKNAWLVTAFAMELIPIVGIHFTGIAQIRLPVKDPFEFPLGLSWLDAATYGHLAIHLVHALYVITAFDPPDLYVDNGFGVNWPGRKYVFGDATIHTLIALRIVYAIHPYATLYIAVAWLSALMELDHRWFLETTEEFRSRLVHRLIVSHEKKLRAEKKGSVLIEERTKSE